MTETDNGHGGRDTVGSPRSGGGRGGGNPGVGTGGVSPDSGNRGGIDAAPSAGGPGAGFVTGGGGSGGGGSRRRPGAGEGGELTDEAKYRVREVDEVADLLDAEDELGATTGDLAVPGGGDGDRRAHPEADSGGG